MSRKQIETSDDGAGNFQKWLHKNPSYIVTPLNIGQAFNNLEDPLTFIHDQHIDRLDAETKNLRNTMQYEKQVISDISKSTYKKVVSRDKINYKFGSAYLEANSRHKFFNYQDFHRDQIKKKEDSKSERKMRYDKKQFIHGNSKLENDMKLQQRPLNMAVIKKLDTKEFPVLFKDVQFFDVFINEIVTEKFPSVYSDISENYEMDEIIKQLKFSLLDKDAYYTEKSTQIMFKAEEELDFWRKYTNDELLENNINEDFDIIRKCSNLNPKEPTFLNLLDFAGGKFDGTTLSRYFQLKQKSELEMKKNENEENLQEEYNRKKEEYDFLKQMKMKDKTQRIAVKQIKNATQTINELQDQSFDSYFQQSAKDLIIKINELNEIRNALMQRRENEGTKKTILVNIGHEMKNLLFRLLSLTLKGETFVSYEQIVQLEQPSLVERKILQIVYHQFHRIKVVEIDGIPKSKILSTYLEEREKNQKMFELLGRNDEKQNKQKAAYTPKKAKLAKK